MTKLELMTRLMESILKNPESNLAMLNTPSNRQRLVEIISELADKMLREVG